MHHLIPNFFLLIAVSEALLHWGWESINVLAKKIRTPANSRRGIFLFVFSICQILYTLFKLILIAQNKYSIHINLGKILLDKRKRVFFLFGGKNRIKWNDKEFDTKLLTSQGSLTIALLSSSLVTWNSKQAVINSVIQAVGVWDKRCTLE